MKIIAVLLLFLGVPAFASKKPVNPSDCKIFYTVMLRDTLGNITQGARKEDLKWMLTDLQSKYPAVCYAPPDPRVHLIFFFTLENAVHEGTRSVPRSSSTSGTVTDNSGDIASYHGNTTTYEPVPDKVEFNKFMLTIETMDDEHKVTVRHRFQQDGLYQTMYGIPLGGRGHHPTKALIEDAVKWVSNGGLTDPLQSSQ